MTEITPTSSRTLRRPAGAPALYAQDGRGYEATVHAHYFVGACDWLVTEYDAEQDLAFGWACLGDRQNAELGYVSLSELESIRVPLVLDVNGTHHQVGDSEVEYDEHWPTGQSLSTAISELDRRQGR